MASTYTVANTDATNCGTRLRNLLNAGGSPGANPSLGVPTSGDSSIGATAVMDAVLDSVGYRAQNQSGILGAASTTSGSYVDIGNGTSTGFPAWSVSIPITKTYLLHIDTSAYSSVGAGAISYQITVDGSAPGGQPASFFNIIQLPAIDQVHRLHYCIPVALTAGTRSIVLQWYTNTTAQVDSLNFRAFTLVG